MTLLFAGTHHAMSPHTHGYAYIVCALFDNKFKSLLALPGVDNTARIGIMPLGAPGHDTSAATLMRLFKEMGTRPDVMQKLRDEQQKARCAALPCPIEPACSH